MVTHGEGRVLGVSHAIASAQVRRAVCQRELSVLFRLLSVIKVFALESVCNSRSRAQACDQ